jgi:hypothetical protein
MVTAGGPEPAVHGTGVEAEPVLPELRPENPEPGPVICFGIGTPFAIMG